MAGDTGQGQTATIFAQSIPNVQSIEVNNTGEILKRNRGRWRADGRSWYGLGIHDQLYRPDNRHAHAGGGYQGGRIGQHHYRERPDQVHVKRGP
jgi:hypothetical protein